MQKKAQPLKIGLAMPSWYWVYDKSPKKGIERRLMGRLS